MKKDRQPSQWSRLADWLVGIRKGFGSGRGAIIVARDSERRSLLNWTLPSFGILFGLFLLFFHELTSFTDNMLFRVFVFDYCLFLFGGLSGWNMARRWRANADQIEEISLTSLSPGAVGTFLLAGPMAIWLRLFLLFAAVDLFTPFSHLRSLAEMLTGFGLDAFSPASIGLALLVLLTHIALVVIMNWFHFESIRLAHWMFAIHSLPRISLVGAGIKNFISMTAIVVGLSALGSAVTGMMVIVAMLLFAFVTMFSSYVVGSRTDILFTSYSVWGFAALFGALLIILLKRQLCRTYERSFAIAWLQYQWWGAGESRQPKQYPMHFRSAFPLWLAYYGAEEEKAAELPERKRVNQRRYQEFLERYKHQAHAANTTQLAPILPGAAPDTSAGNNSGFPSQLPDQHSAPLHDQEHSAAKERNLE